MKVLITILLTLTTYTVVGMEYDYGGDEFNNFLMEEKKLPSLREHSVVVTKDGYYPNVITLFEDETLRLFVTTTEKDKLCLMIPEKKIFLSANHGRLTSAEMKFGEAGEYKFFCPTGKISGKVVVLKNPHKKKRKTRMPASVGKVWMPRES